MELVRDAGHDLLGGLGFVGVGECIVFVRVNDGWVPGCRVGGSVLAVDVVQRGAEVPGVADVDGDTGVHLGDGADDAVVPLIHARGAGGSFVAELNTHHPVHASSYLLGNEYQATLRKSQVRLVAPELRPAAASSTMNIFICTARQGMHVKQDPDPTPMTSGDKSLDCLPRVDIDLSRLPREGCVVAVRGAQREVTDGETDARAVRGVD